MAKSNPAQAIKAANARVVTLEAELSKAKGTIETYSRKQASLHRIIALCDQACDAEFQRTEAERAALSATKNELRHAYYMVGAFASALIVTLGVIVL